MSLRAKAKRNSLPIPFHPLDRSQDVFFGNQAVRLRSAVSFCEVRGVTFPNYPVDDELPRIGVNKG